MSVGNCLAAINLHSLPTDSNLMVKDPAREGEEVRKKEIRNGTDNKQMMNRRTVALHLISLYLVPLDQ